uniref:Uncharacterized protein n=1 Tax=Utricularia reniformis TaxID=192314 RepID=A0A1Y0B3H3_9LAMI|nr:hypothetical protein AEK19_MT1774 [Utricularia reniformis]ART31948.1 hypothetical protein AEK19_MT1774 [Utricularia reniformis]
MSSMILGSIELMPFLVVLEIPYDHQYIYKESAELRWNACYQCIKMSSTNPLSTVFSLKGVHMAVSYLTRKQLIRSLDNGRAISQSKSLSCRLFPKLQPVVLQSGSRDSLVFFFSGLSACNFRVTPLEADPSFYQSLKCFSSFF